MGKLIVIEGLDGCGKSTQLNLLEEYFKTKNMPVHTVSFPAYDLPSCQPVKMYLNGEFGDKPGDVNGYAASTFYAIDRYASYKLQWQNLYQNGATILAGRYVTSNIIHQCSKLDEAQWPEFINWLNDLEYEKMGIPKPDCVLFLDVPIEVSQGLLNGRYQSNGGKKDIHESDIEYLKNCRKAALYAAKHNHWTVINCTENGQMRTREAILDDILKQISNI